MATITTRPCLICDTTSEVEATEDQARAYVAGEPVQDIWPDMPRAEREVLVSGIHPGCWAAAFGTATA